MNERGACTAEIGYPPRIDPVDDAWLLAKVAHHDGELSSLVMESFPAQRLARFKTVPAAHAFIGDLERTGGWTASLRLGWVGSGFQDDGLSTPTLAPAPKATEGS